MNTFHSGRILILACGVALAAPLYTGCTSTATRESTGEYVDDTIITGKVKSALFADKEVSGLAVKVETFKGTVQLSGFVDTQAQKDQAGRIAAGTRGVTAVANNIIVKVPDVE